MQIKIEFSIIIPVYNNLNSLLNCLKSLEIQDTPQDYFEVIVIDNGSEPKLTKSALTNIKLQNLQLIREDQFLNSPYSARNRGIEKANGNIIIFLDTGCVASKSWLKNGAQALKNADMIGGGVRFNVNEGSTAAELYDSFFNIQMKTSVLERKVAKTCNLFVKRKVVNAIGLFKEGYRSGEDVRWSSAATDHGFKMDYSEEAYVTNTARKFWPLAKKQFRVAKGQPKIWKARGQLSKNFIKRTFLCWLPINPITLKKRIKESALNISPIKFIHLFFLGWFLRIINGLGNVVGFITK